MRFVNIWPVLIDTLLPNRAWTRRVANAGQYRALYWTLRIALGALFILLALFFGFRKPELH
jgi:hypothetical protein